VGAKVFLNEYFVVLVHAGELKFTFDESWSELIRRVTAYEERFWTVEDEDFLTLIVHTPILGSQITLYFKLIFVRINLHQIFVQAG